jgi:hypothetical protein
LGQHPCFRTIKQLGLDNCKIEASHDLTISSVTTQNVEHMKPSHQSLLNIERDHSIIMIIGTDDPSEILKLSNVFNWYFINIKDYIMSLNSLACLATCSHSSMQAV